MSIEEKRQEISAILAELVMANDDAKRDLDDAIQRQAYRTGMEAFVVARVTAHNAAIEKLVGLAQ